MSSQPAEASVLASRIQEAFDRHGVQLTLGGEPTYVPLDPVGEEWTHAAVGPAKLAAAWSLAHRLAATAMPTATIFFSPGKAYPGEQDPRWSIWLLARRDGVPLFQSASAGRCTANALADLRRQICRALGLADTWRSFVDPVPGSTEVWALLLDAPAEAGRPRVWLTHPWPEAARELLAASGPAGLRLPLSLLAADVPRRSLTLEWRGERLAMFLPPLLQPAFTALLDALSTAVQDCGIVEIDLQGSVPADEARVWTRLGLAADPGVLEVNLPACSGWAEYDHWMRMIDQAARDVGLRPHRHGADGEPTETGGGNHLLWGGPCLESNPFFTRPAWLASILRYWQRHPALSYCFSGSYLGPCSQAPRADESGRELHDLDWTWSYLAALLPGDRREEISAALRHLQADLSGNNHRTEISFDKFWNPGVPGGGQGLVEFRAIAMMPQVAWASDVALLWSGLAAWLLERPCELLPRPFGRQLQDHFFLPSLLWLDLEAVLGELGRDGFVVDPERYRPIWDWRFPVVLSFTAGDASLTVRRAGEHWPVLTDTPAVGGTTSRFVDASLQRLEFLANDAFARDWSIELAGRPLALHTLAELPAAGIAGLRYRHSQLHPCLHPGIPAHMPLELTLRGPDLVRPFRLDAEARRFEPAAQPFATPAGPPCRPIHAGDLTYDLRVGGID
jgi:uncharacterized protein (DUF2126 family)